MSERKEILEMFKINNDFRSKVSLTETEIDNLNFTTETTDPLAEALKKLIFTYCRKDADVTILRNINMAIEKAVKGS